jgi:DNA invertase Pin-like site-specific DNA recombinase
MRCAVYCRLSLDRTGEELGVERQLEDCLRLVESRGDQLVDKYVDNDSPAKGIGKRDEYARLMAAVQRGEIDRIYVWSQGRLWRNRVERAQGFEILRDARVSLIQVKGPEVDMTTAMGRMIAGIIGEFDTGENEVKAERQVREALQRADRGLPPGGRRAFGYRDVEVVEEEAEAVKAAYAKLLAGTTLSRIARDMTAAGYRTTVGGQWTINGVRTMLLNPRYAGHRTYLGRIHGPGAWPALVDETTYEAVRAMLTDPDRKVSRTNALTWLGTGLYVCGRCPGQTVICTYRGIKARGTQRRVYRCPVCYMTRVADPVDKWVVAFVAELLSRSDRLAERLSRRKSGPDAGALSTEARALRVRLDALGDNLDIDEADLARRTRKLRARLAEIAQALAESGRGSAAGALAATGDPRGAWLALDDIARRQAVIRDLCTVRLLPMGPGRKPFDPESVDIT